ncbi:GTPase Era [Candidatus Amarolinea dominans]|uniref:GTPase Era n=1 Tax=Candidatus Amarolinea dominans TaxID=3140696 RepID=UPI0031CCA335
MSQNQSDADKQPLPVETAGHDHSSAAPEHRAGFVAIIGRPNVGKSTLLNAILGQKIAITAPKPQTTRSRLLGILTLAEAQIVFVDTPGIHRPRHKLGEYMVQQAVMALPDADVILWIVDIAEPPFAEDEQIALLLAQKAAGRPVVIGCNKVDLVNASTLAERQAVFSALVAPTALVTLAAARGQGIDDLIAVLRPLLPLSPPYYPADQVTDVQERFIAAELVREAVIHHLREEVPHAVAVVVDEFKTRGPEMTYIAATVYVERESQKGIVLGLGGRMLKQIGQQARVGIEEMLETKVYLELWVKVVPHWRRDLTYLRRFGYAAE